jgi:two-component system sensor kinase FixL
LSISRTIVTSHGGRMWFERRPSGGTAVHFTVPALEEPGLRV